MNKYSLAATITAATCTMLQLGAWAQTADTSQAASIAAPAAPAAPMNTSMPRLAPSSSEAASAAPGAALPGAVPIGAPVPSGATVSSPPTGTGMPSVADIINPSLPKLQSPPLMGTITEEVAITVDKQPIRRGPYTGLTVHLHNGTNSPLMFDGDRARVRIGADQLVPAVSDASLEAAVAPEPTRKHEWRVGIDNALTVGASSAIHDELVDRGPILPRFQEDQMRREATLERFGLRILWPGDDTEGIVFFATGSSLDKAKLEVPVATFPTMEIRGYLTGLR